MAELWERIRAVAPPIAARLTPLQIERYRQHAERLIERVNWEAARGFALDDQVIATIAAHAGVLVAGFELSTNPFRDVTSVVVHGSTIVADDVVPGPVRGVVAAGRRHLAGQSGHGRGPIVLDWRTARREIADPDAGNSVIVHEFAHKLDQLDGVHDGRPPLGSDAAREAWDQTLGTNFRRLRRRGHDPLVKAYGATNPAEYFAVTSELFFTVPTQLADQHPRVYKRLADFYCLDLASGPVSGAHRDDRVETESVET